MPNYAALFAEAVTDSMRDYARDNPGVLVPGYWLIRVRKLYPELPAKIWLCDHEPGEPDNKVERPYLAAEIAGQPADPLDVYAARGKRLIEDKGRGVEAEYRFLVSDLRWAREHAPRDPAAAFQRRIDLTRLEPISPPPGPGDKQ